VDNTIKPRKKTDLKAKIMGFNNTLGKCAVVPPQECEEGKLVSHSLGKCAVVPPQEGEEGKLVSHFATATELLFC
jgi:hypothetical protein